MKQLVPSFPEGARVPHCSTCGRGPGKTTRSKKSPDRPVVDIDLTIEWEGGVYVCWDCAEEIGSLVGMIYETKANELTEAAEQAKEQLAETQYDLTVARDALDALRAEYENRDD